MTCVQAKPHCWGICSWAIDRHDVLAALNAAAQVPLIDSVQLGFFSEAALRQAKAMDIGRAAARVALAGVFLAFEGEDYASVQSIARTGGYAPDDAFERRLELTIVAGKLAQACGCHTLALHVGTIPDTDSHPDFAKLRDRTRLAADRLAADGISLLLETGRESASALLLFIRALDRSNVGVNFDPANFVVYGSDDPRTAAGQLSTFVRVVHVKDARYSARPGAEFGSPAAMGEGDAGLRECLQELLATGFRGPLLIELSRREAGIVGVRGALRTAGSWPSGPCPVDMGKP